MNFSTDIKDEIVRVKVEDMQKTINELAGFMPICGRIHFLGNQRYCLSFTTGNAATSRRIFSFLKTLYHGHITVGVRKNQQLRERNVYHIRLEDYDLSKVFLDDIKFLKNENVFMPNYEVDPYSVRVDSLKGIFLKGAFLGSGILSDLSKTYHVESIASQSFFAQSIQSLLSAVHLKANIAKRKEEYIICLKEAEMTPDPLNLMGSSQGVLAFENVRVMRDMRDQVNRLVNYEAASLSKTINAVLGQVKDIRLIEERIGLDKLPDSLEEVARIRLPNPSSSLRELRGRVHPTVGRNGVNRHLEKIRSIVNRLRDENK